jgi:hypothetical protein
MRNISPTTKSQIKKGDQTMKKLIFTAILGLFTAFCFGQYTNSSTIQVKSYTKKDGTVVQSHTKTAPNNTNWDNYSTKPNVNVNTGEKGYKAPDYSPAANNYGSGKTIYTGPNGGQYYINSNGNKAYVPKR